MVWMRNIGNAAKARGGAMVRSRYINLEALVLCFAIKR
jgi:hypothetical protein